MTGAEFIVKAIIKAGTDTVFGYPGGTVVSLCDALYKERRFVRTVRTSHEQGAAHAADGYARASGRAGVCFTTSGPGATNLVTGIATAFMDSVPVVFITGNVECSLIGTDSFQEVDIIGITLSVTKHSFMVRSAGDLIKALDNAFRIAMADRQGPVLIDVPKDILEAQAAEYAAALESMQPSGALPEAKATEPYPETEALASMRAKLLAAERPLVIAGGGARHSGAGGSILELARRLKLPVVSTLMGAGILPAEEPEYLGMLGKNAPDYIKRAVEECDLILAAGTRFSTRVREPEMYRGKTVLQIDTDRAEINKLLVPDAFVLGDAAEVLKTLLKGLPERQKRSWTERLSAEKAAGLKSRENREIPGKGWLKGAEVLAELKAALGPGALIATDVGNHQMLTAACYPFDPEDTFLTSGGLGTMGFGMGAAIGGMLSCPGRRTALVTGDGSFMMNLNELATAAGEKLPLIVLVFRNRQLGMVHDMQAQSWGRRYSATKLGRLPDIKKLAGAFGIRGVKIRTLEQLREELSTAISENRALVLDIPVKG